jgi:hypothetical protein
MANMNMVMCWWLGTADTDVENFLGIVISTLQRSRAFQSESAINAACHGMFADFSESFRRGLSQAEIFEPLVRYAQICEDNIKLLKSLAKRSVPSHSR